MSPCSKRTREPRSLPKTSETVESAGGSRYALRRGEAAASVPATASINGIRDALDRARATLDERRQESHVVDAGLRIYERDRRFPTPFLVGALTTSLIIYIIPFFVLMLFGLGFYADLAERNAEEAGRSVGLAGLFARAAEDSTTAAAQWRAATFVVVIFAVLWAADRIARNVRRIFAAIWQVAPVRSRWHWLAPVGVIAISMIVLGLASLGVRAADHGAAWFTVTLIVSFILIAILWMLVSRSLPHAPGATNWRDFLPGSLLMSSAFFALKAVTVLYFSARAASLEVRYGSIGIVLVLLSWTYLIGLATVASADVNAAAFQARAIASTEGRSTTATTTDR